MTNNNNTLFRIHSTRYCLQNNTTPSHLSQISQICELSNIITPYTPTSIKKTRSTINTFTRRMSTIKHNHVIKKHLNR